MTIFELSIGLSGLGGAIAGGAAGLQAGILGGCIGMVAGGLASLLAALATAAATGLMAFAFAWFEQDPQPVPRQTPAGTSRVRELGFLMFVSPVALAPVWVPLLVYRIVTHVASS